MIFLFFQKMSIVVNCRKSNKKVFFIKYKCINGFGKSLNFWVVFAIAFCFFVFYNGLKSERCGGKNYGRCNGIE